ncbi:MAG: hypothetical protein AAF376_10980 [Pseudomonadota bacterium]
MTSEAVFSWAVRGREYFRARDNNMTIIMGRDDPDHAVKTVGRAFDALETATETLQAAVNALKLADPTFSDKQVVTDIRALNGALLFAMKTQEAARAAGHEGFGGGGQLNLEEARDEIGVRLACLRSAGCGGDVSGGSE